MLKGSVRWREFLIWATGAAVLTWAVWRIPRMHTVARDLTLLLILGVVAISFGKGRRLTRILGVVGGLVVFLGLRWLFWKIGKGPSL